MIEQLTNEKVALEKAKKVLTGPEGSIEAIRKEFLALADKAPTKEQFTPKSAVEWYKLAYAMKQQTVASDSDLFLMNFNDEVNATYDDLLESVGSLRAIAINLRGCF